MTLDDSMNPVVCAACSKEAPFREDARTPGTAHIAPEQLHGLGWVYAAGGPGWVCGECAPGVNR